MNMRSLKPWMLVALGAASFARPVDGQQIDSPYRFLDHSQYVGPFGGYAWLSDGRIGLGPEPAPIGGISWAIRVSGPFAAAVDVGFISSTRAVRDTVFLVTEDEFQQTGEADVSLAIAMANLRFNVTGARTWNGFQPFALLGAGAVTDLAGAAAAELELEPDERYDSGTSFAGQFGAGVDWFPSPRVSVRVDARNMLWKLPIPEAFRLTETGEDFPESEWEQNFALTMGLSIHF